MDFLYFSFKGNDMSHPKNSTTPPIAQPHPLASAHEIREAERNHRGALAVFQMARTLRENRDSGSSPDTRLLTESDEYGILLAMEFIASDIYALVENRLSDMQEAAQ